MVNSHYIPQLILRHFSDHERIQYCDIDNRTSERRNIKTIFSEKGYYPDQLEEKLCHKSEAQFANLLNNKILKERFKVVLTPEELFILKKYLIVTTIRYNITEIMKKYENQEQLQVSYSKDFFGNINKVLDCTDLEQMADFMMKVAGNDAEGMMKKAFNTDKYADIKLFSDIKNILHSYVVLVSTNKIKDDFVIPDVGFSYKASHIKCVQDEEEFDKCFYTLNYAMMTGNPYLLKVSNLLTPYDYIICPVSKNLAIISFSVFYKFFNNKADIYGLLPVNGMTVNSLLGFGSSDLVEPPKVKRVFGKAVSYEYPIKELSMHDIIRINATMINITESHFGYYSYEGIKRSIEYYNALSPEYRRYDMSFLTV